MACFEFKEKIKEREDKCSCLQSDAPAERLVSVAQPCGKPRRRQEAASVRPCHTAASEEPQQSIPAPASLSNIALAPWGHRHRLLAEGEV